MGLVNAVVSATELDEYVERLALQSAKLDGLAVRMTKQALNQTYEMMGMRHALEAALAIDVEIETTETPESRAFMGRSRPPLHRRTMGCRPIV